MTAPRVLFLCIHNSARSQLAEAMLRAWGGDRFEAYSAGAEATQVRPEAIAVGREIGLDLTGQESKTVQRYAGETFDWVVTVCSDGRELCPYFPGARQRAHWELPDPSAVEGDESQRLTAYRAVRDRLAEHMREFVAGA
jgi:arsenate reductase (thioredoxin)